MTFCSQTLHVQTRRKVDVRHQAVTARVTWRACTPTIGACPAVRTKTGCHQKVSALVTHQTNTGLAYLPNLWPSCSLMFSMFLWSLLCLAHSVCCVFAVVVGPCLIFQWRGGFSEGSDRLHLHLSCDLLHGAMVLLADCQLNVPVVMKWEMRPWWCANNGDAAIGGMIKSCQSAIYLSAWDFLFH